MNPKYGIDWQHLILLLYAIENIGGDIPTKAATVDFIRSHGLIKLREDDRKPYPSCSEPSWETGIAWSRKTGVMMGFVHNLEWNSWAISRAGREFLADEMAIGSRGKTDAGRCFLWSDRFKQIVVPSHIPSDADAVAPPKGTRTLVKLSEEKKLVQDYLVHYTIEQLAQHFGRKLGFRVPPTEPSVAFAIHRYKNSTDLRHLID